jgi:hypothetical protein
MNKEAAVQAVISEPDDICAHRALLRESVDQIPQDFALNIFV